MANRTGKGCWKPGQSGNKAGTTKSMLSKREWMEGIIGEENKKNLVIKAMELGLAGKPSMLELLLARVLPPVSTDDTVKVNLKNKTHKERSDEILLAIEDGRLTPSQGHQLFAMLCDSVKLAEMTEVIDRITKLEEAQKLK